MTFGGTYVGSLVLNFEDEQVVGVTCILNGRDCDFDAANGGYIDPVPTGPNPGSFTMNDSAQLRSSTFIISDGGGSYSYSTDYVFSADGSEVYYYNNVGFTLSELTYETTQPAPIPLPASLPLLAGAVFGFGALRRWRKIA